MSLPSDYPAQWETHAVLKDGSTVELRPIQAGDRDALETFHGRQSQESIYFRYFRYRPELSDKELDYFTQVDYRDRMAFVAFLGKELVAVARYETLKSGDVAEVAFFVDDDHHGKGLATLMLEYLAAAARARGLHGFTATVLAENYRMLAVFRSAGYQVNTRFSDGHIEVELGIDVTPETSSAIDDRQRLATARSVARIVEPSTVAVIGASRQPGTVGHQLVANLKAGAEANGFDPAARIYPVNPSADQIGGVACHPTIGDATAALRTRPPAEERGPAEDDGEPDVEPGEERNPDERTIDLAVVAVRADLVQTVVEQCVEAGVRGLLVISAGFSELDGDGRQREQRLVDLARDNGMRLIGPNAFGLINTDPRVGLAAVFHPIATGRGSVALASQSGPLGAALIERINSAGLGLSSFVGVGNRADVSVNDLLDYWDLDDRTDVVVLYVENFGNLRNFSKVARRLSMSKPVIAIKPASPERQELLHQAGVMLVDQVSQLADQARLAATQPVARGNRVVIISNAASLGRLATSACRGQGLEVVVPASVSAAARDDSVLIGDLDTVSLMPSGDPDDYERLAVAAAVSDEVDLILLAVAPTAYLPVGRLGRLLNRLNRSIDKPMVAIGLVDTDVINVEGLPTFTFPEEAAQVLGRHARYGSWRSERLSYAHPADEPAPAEMPGPAARRIDWLMADGESHDLSLADPELEPLLADLGIPVAPFSVAADEDELVKAAKRLGYPVVLKAADLAPRSIGESGGAAIDLHDSGALLAAYRRMSSLLGTAMDTAIVQRMIPGAQLVRLELRQDQRYGAMIRVGRGGSGLEQAPAAARRFVPLDEGLAEALLDAAVADGRLHDLDEDGRAALLSLIEALDRAAAETDHLVDISLNPVIVAGSATMPADVRVVLRPVEPDQLAGLRHI